MKKTIIMSYLILLFTAINYGQTNNAIQRHNTNKKIVVGTKTELNYINERVFTTTIIISELALLLIILYYWKKTRGERKNSNEVTLKRNIKALREEKIKYFEDEKLSFKRKMLYLKMNKKNIDGRFITAKAKKLSISKGEIFLTARIKQLQART